MGQNRSRIVWAAVHIKQIQRVLLKFPEIDEAIRGFFEKWNGPSCLSFSHLSTINKSKSEIISVYLVFIFRDNFAKAN